MEKSAKNTISVVIPTWNEEGNIELLVKRIHDALSKANIIFEIVIVDDHSTDNTQKIVLELCKKYPIRPYLKNGKRGKAQSLLQGFSVAKYDLIAMIDADLQYPPEAIPQMLDLIDETHGVVIGNRIYKNVSKPRRVFSQAFRFIFGKNLHNLDVDVQSGLKVFKREIIERITLSPSPWTFDLEFLVKARNSGYLINSYDIEFTERTSGKSKVNLLRTTFEIASRAVILKSHRSEFIPFTDSYSKEEGEGFHFKGTKYTSHTKLPFKQSAFESLLLGQKVILILLLCLLIFFFIQNWYLTIIGVISALTIIYFIDSLFYFYLSVKSLKNNPEIKITKEEIKSADNYNWPTYTILCPLYKEAEVLPQFIQGINDLDYPKDKLQVLLLLEEDDKVTINEANNSGLPSYVDIVIVPHSIPKTKPKACNFGIKRAKGEYIVIYDAEDIPEPDQLKKVVLAFNKSVNIGCVQAKLNFYNSHQNLFTQLFAAEYALWFDLVLPSLQSIDAPIPLGGTSNHFKRVDIENLHGWDPFNVTEDADLGIRLYKSGYRTAMIDSTTFEEANSNLRNWLKQRSRWVKGYIQTYFVHMREPRKFFKNSNYINFLTFNLTIAGKVSAMLINPLLWIMTILYLFNIAGVDPFIKSLFPSWVYYTASLTLVFGNFFYLYAYFIGLAKRRLWNLMPFTFFTPIYWILMSISAYFALWEFIRRPHYWFKTQHGLHLKKETGNDFITITRPAFVWEQE